MNEILTPTQVGILAKKLQSRFSLLLAALFLLIFVSPFVGMLESEFGQSAGGSIIGLAFSLVLVATAWAVSETKFHRWVTLSLVAFILIMRLGANGFDSRGLQWAQTGLSILFLAYSVVLIVRFSFRNNVVDFDAVSASLCGYLLIGVCFANGYLLISEADGNAFHYSQSENNFVGNEQVFSFDNKNSVMSLYFSFVTLTTVGFGDITPTSNFSRIVVAVEALMGQVYLVVLVARMVGLHVAQAARR